MMSATDNPRPISVPADPSAPSFLNLPPEIRNGVYEALFKYEKTILIYINWGDRFWVPGIQLLSTCRQINDEAIGILYTKNRFLFSGTWELTNLVKGAAGWLDKIGHQASLVESVLIDARCWREGIDILPILRHLWESSDPQSKIAFTDAPEWACDASLITFDATSPGSASYLNQVLAALVSDNDLKIKKYAQFRRMLDQVVVEPEGEHVIYFYSPSNACKYALPSISFKVSKKCKLERSYENNPRPSLEGILDDPSIRDTIVQMVLSGHGEAVHDISKKTIFPQLPGILGATKHLRNITYRAFAKKLSVTKLTTTDHKCSFTSDLLTLKHSPWAKRWSCYGLGPETLVLRFEVANAMSVDDIRFNATKFLQATMTFSTRTKVRIELVCLSIHKRPFTMLLSDIRNVVLVFLPELSEKSNRHGEGPCPSVWMDGRGVAREAEFGSDSEDFDLVSNDDNDFSFTIVHRKAKSLAEEYLSNDPPTEGVEEGSWRGFVGQLLEEYQIVYC